MKIILAATVALCAFSGPGLADAFDTAVTAWLQMDDATALPALSDLAKAGDERAMLLLGVIDMAWPRSDWLQGLGRAKINAMMRVPGGLSGKSWLTAVQDQKALALALTYGGPTDDPAARATVLLQAGEWAAATAPLLTSQNSNPSSLATIAQNVALPDHMNHLLWWSAGFASNPLYFAPGTARDSTPQEQALLDEALSADWAGSYQSRLYLSLLPEETTATNLPLDERLTNLSLRLGETQFTEGAIVMGQPVTKAEYQAANAAAAAILMTTPELAPIRHLCQAACPAAVSDCTRSLYGEARGEYAVIALVPPLVTLVPADRYYASPRYLDDLRRMVIPLEGRKQAPPAYAACAMTLLHP